MLDISLKRKKKFTNLIRISEMSSFNVRGVNYKRNRVFVIK